ncbi:MAG: GAF domain-containing protein [Phormidesmis sp.]
MSSQLSPAQIRALQARVAELEADNQRLRASEFKKEADQEHAQLLTTVARVANLLLRSPDYTAVLSDVVRLLGDAVECDRCGIGENVIHPISGAEAVSIRPEWEWRASGILPSETFSPHADRLYLREDAPNINAKLLQGEVVNCLVSDLPEPERSLLASQGNTVESFVPIFVNQQVWGFIGFDNCTESRLYDEAEIAILQVAADSIAAAIERDQVQQEREQAIQQRAAELAEHNRVLQGRDRILEVTATAANALLTTECLDDGVNTALQIIGESLDTDRVTVIEIEPFDATSNFSLVGWAAIHEWHSSYADSQLLNPSFNKGTFDGMEVLLERGLKGESVSYLTEELSEPFRSGQVAVGVKALHTVPIFVEDQFLGVLGIDDCREATHRSQAELAVLKTAAACIGSAIQRDRTQKVLVEERLQAETALIRERNRFARDIHDVLAQVFTGVLIQLEATKRKIGNGQRAIAQDHIARARNLAQSGLNDARRSARALRPESLESNDLPAALQQLAQQMVSDGEVHIRVEIDGTASPISGDVEDNLLRIAQEAVTNALRHAAPKSVILQLRFAPDQLCLQISDDGCGFDTKLNVTNGFGLLSMKERAQFVEGEFGLTSEMGRGTTVTIIVPMEVVE